jgi:hypothetical protein
VSLKLKVTSLKLLLLLLLLLPQSGWMTPVAGSLEAV